MRYLLFLPLLALAAACRGQQTDTTALAPYSAPAYRATLRHFATRRAALAEHYSQAATPAARAACLTAARELWLTTLDSTIFPA